MYPTKKKGMYIYILTYLLKMHSFFSGNYWSQIPELQWFLINIYFFFYSFFLIFFLRLWSQLPELYWLLILVYRLDYEFLNFMVFSFLFIYVSLPGYYWQQIPELPWLFVFFFYFLDFIYNCRNFTDYWYWFVILLYETLIPVLKYVFFSVSLFIY